MGAGYGLASPGIFRTPYPLNRFGYGGGSEVDPTAALIGNALGSLQSVRAQGLANRDRQQQLDDQKQYRDLQTGIQLAGQGLTTQAPTPNVTGAAGGLPFSGVTAASPVASVDGTNIYRAGPRPADEHQRQVHIAVGRALAGQMGMGQVSDDVAEGIGAAPQSFVGLQKIQDAQPKYHIENGQWVPDAPPPGSPPGRAVPVPGYQTPEAKPTPKQMDNASYGAAALAAWRNVEKLRTDNPSVETEVGQILTNPKFLAAVPGLHSSEDAGRALGTAGGSPAAQNYMRAKWSFLDNIIRTRIQGGRLSGPLFLNSMNEFMPALDPAANGQMRQNEINAILTAQGESGYDVNPSLWNHATKRLGVDQIDLQDALAGGHGDKRMNAIRGRY